MLNWDTAGGGRGDNKHDLATIAIVSGGSGRVDEETRHRGNLCHKHDPPYPPANVPDTQSSIHHEEGMREEESDKSQEEERSPALQAMPVSSVSGPL